jgi:ribosomal protein L18E
MREVTLSRLQRHTSDGEVVFVPAKSSDMEHSTKN